MKVAIPIPSKRLFSFQFSEEGRDKNTENIFSLFLPLLKVVLSLDIKTAKYRNLTRKKGTSCSTSKL
jgi:hypothetical protein